MKLFHAAIAVALLGLAAVDANAQAYPDKPVRLVVPFTPGGGTDLIARLVGQKLNERWNQPVTVENKTGANGNIGAQFVAKEKPDGYTILVSTSAITINPSLNETTGYKQSEFTPVILLATSPFLLVANPKLVPPNTLQEFIAWAKTQPDVAWASTSEGNAEHLAGSMFAQASGLKMRHIPYKGGADALKDVLGGHVPIGVISLPSSLPYLQSGQLKVLAITDSRRAPQIPDVPTMEEAGVKGVELPTWYAVWVPAGTPTDIVDRIHDAIDATLKLDDVQKRVVAIGFNPSGGTRAQFTDFTRSETDKYARIIQTLGLKKQ